MGPASPEPGSESTMEPGTTTTCRGRVQPRHIWRNARGPAGEIASKTVFWPWMLTACDRRILRSSMTSRRRRRRSHMDSRARSSSNRRTRRVGHSNRSKRSNIRVVWRNREGIRWEEGRTTTRRIPCKEVVKTNNRHITMLLRRRHLRLRGFLLCRVVLRANSQHIIMLLRRPHLPLQEAPTFRLRKVDDQHRYMVLIRPGHSRVLNHRGFQHKL
jgi:hypothetical protein